MPINPPKYDDDDDINNLYHINIPGINYLLKKRFNNKKFEVILKLKFRHIVEYH